MENRDHLQINCYYLFEHEEGVKAKTRLFCTKGALFRCGDFERARKMEDREECARYSKQKKGGLYVNIVPPRTGKNHNGAYPHHAFILAATKDELKKQSSLYDPDHIQMYSFGDMGEHALLLIFSDDFAWDNSGRIIAGKIEVLIFGRNKCCQSEIYQRAIKGEFDAEIEVLRKIAIEDKPLAKGENMLQIRIDAGKVILEELYLPHLYDSAERVAKVMQATLTQ